jgi:hypothetical protein
LVRPGLRNCGGELAETRKYCPETRKINDGITELAG